jgi:hypothetical protein
MLVIFLSVAVAKRFSIVQCKCLLSAITFIIFNQCPIVPWSYLSYCLTSAVLPVSLLNFRSPTCLNVLLPQSYLSHCFTSVVLPVSLPYFHGHTYLSYCPTSMTLPVLFPFFHALNKQTNKLVIAASSVHFIKNYDLSLALVRPIKTVNR